MADPSLREIRDALADQIRDALDSTVTGLQVEPRLIFNPTPPTIDVYFPSAPFEQTAMGHRNREVQFTVRARVAGDHQAEQDWLCDLMDPRSSESVVAAVGKSLSLNGSSVSVGVEGPTEYGQYPTPGGQSYLGCTWAVKVEL
jgi:hypothetical protein